MHRVVYYVTSVRRVPRIAPVVAEVPVVKTPVRTQHTSKLELQRRSGCLRRHEVRRGLPQPVNRQPQRVPYRGRLCWVTLVLRQHG